MADVEIGRYQIKYEIARGGMASVYHAYDPRFERDVAIKVLPQVFLHDPQFRVRFEREAKMIALLEHPGIVPVYDFGEQGGQPYIVMRYMSGGSLTDRLKQGSLSVEETEQIVVRIAPALDAAHARGIIHRDLKPGNILFDQYGNAFVADFGIARATMSGSATLTGGAILGTPAYMSPEQVQGEKDIDGRSDIYALGVLVYQMLTGKTPYTSDTPAKVMMMHVLEPVPSLLEYKSDLPAGSEALIEKSMAKNPDDRFSTAGEIASTLENIARGDPTATLAAAGETVIGGQTVQSGHQMETALSAGATVPAAPATQASIPVAEAPAAAPGRPRIVSVGITALVLLFIIVGAIAALAYFGRQGSGPLAFLAPATPTSLPTHTPTTILTTEIPEPTETEVALVLPTDTEISSTATETPLPMPDIPVIGGADKIAYLSDSDIWVASLDGSDLVQLTTDGTEKINLQFTPDGKAVQYISGKCIRTANLEDEVIGTINCFNFVDYLKTFEISPDGKQVAASFDNQMYILPYDMQVLGSIQTRSDLTEVAECKEFAPYTKNFVKFIRWSRDGKQLAMVIMGNAAGIGSADTIQVIPSDECVPKPRGLDNFPPPRYTPEEYAAAPSILTFGWDGLSLFAHSTYIQHGGFGHLYVYNMDLKKARMRVNPIDDRCCYRDPIFSPDGSHLLVAYQGLPGSDQNIKIYLIPYGSIGTGATYEPLPLPPITNITEKPLPALRPAQ